MLMIIVLGVGSYIIGLQCIKESLAGNFGSVDILSVKSHAAETGGLL